MDTDRYAQKEDYGEDTKRMPYEVEGRNWNDRAISQGTAKIIRKPPEAEEETLNRVLCTPSEETHPVKTLAL